MIAAARGEGNVRSFDDENGRHRTRKRAMHLMKPDYVKPGAALASFCQCRGLFRFFATAEKSGQELLL